MSKYTLSPINLDKDLPQIALWDKKYKTDPRFESITKYVLENNTLYSLDEIIETNYIIYPIGDDEERYVFVAKNKKKDVCGFAIVVVSEIDTNQPFLGIQYLVVDPDHQNKGVGTFILDELLNNSQKYFKINPTYAYTRIHVDNKPSQKLFNKFGFKFKKNHDIEFLDFDKNMLDLAKDRE